MPFDKPQRTNMSAITIDHLRGDTWLGYPSISVQLNGEPLDLSGANILMQMRRSPSASEVAKEFTVTMVDELAGAFRVEPTIMDCPPSTYFADIELTLADGRVLTVISLIFNILPDVSRAD